MTKKEKEECINCFDYTGRAGRGEDSIYVELKELVFKDNKGEYGPLCELCFDSLKKLDWIEE